MVTERAELHGGERRRSAWFDIARRVVAGISRTNLSLIAAGLAFYAFVAIPSAFTGLVALYGLAFDRFAIAQQLQNLRGLVPDDALNIMGTALTRIASSSSSGLSVALAMSVGVALWSTHSGTGSLMTALTIAYEEEEKRGFLRFTFDALMLAVFGTVFVIFALSLVAVLPAVIELLPLGTFGKTAAAILRWPVLAFLAMGSLAAIYRLAPCRARPRWRLVSWGTVAATLLWLAGSAGFSFYVSEFASYEKSYGSLGAVVALLMWLYLTCFIVLLGAEINAEIERQA